MKLKTAIFILIILGLKTLATAQELQQLRFIAKGVAESQYFNKNGSGPRLTNAFSCDVSADKYSMSFTVSDPNDARTFAINCLYDGTDVFFTRCLSTNAVTSVVTFKNGQLITHQLKTPSTPNNNAILRIGAGSIPPPDNPAVILVWLGLGSIADTNAPLAPIQNPLQYLGPVYDREHIQFRTAARMHHVAPGFLEWREDYHEGYKYSEDGNHLETTPLPGEFSGGYTNSIFRVLNWTNVGNLEFPQKMQLECFYYDSSGQQAGVKRYLECTASVNVINVAGESVRDFADSKAAFSPQVIPKTFVADTRQSITGQKDTRYYLSQDGKLLSSSQLTTNHHYFVTEPRPTQEAYP